MLTFSNQGPLIRGQRSASEHSLYTDNSDKSQQLHFQAPKRDLQSQQTIEKQPSIEIPPIVTITEPPARKQEPQKMPPRQTQNKRSNQKFPQIRSNSNKSGVEKGKNLFNNSFVNDAAERHALFNEKMSSIEIKEERIPKINYLHQKQHIKSDKQKSRRYGPLEGANSQAQRFLGSRQGSRWLKSQSLNVSREQKGFNHMIRHFHRHNSVLIQSLNRFWQHFESTEKILNSSPYKISLYDTLQSMKLKMEGYLQRRVNLQNFQTEKPTPEWTQEQYMTFYTNYKRVYLKEDEPQINKPFTLKKYKNCVFFGRMSDGKKDEGVLHYFNGKCFEGKFKQDQKQYGLQIDEKQLYLGQFRKGLRHGEGILKTTQSLFVGQFTFGEFTTVANPRQQSASTSFYLNQNIQKPNYHNRKGFQITHSLIKVYEAGLCITKNNFGDIFIGDLSQDGQKHEEGLELFANGDIYIGRYESDSPQGYGQYYWENGSFYRGQFLSGMRHGRGIWQMINGDFYEGEYMNDKKNGKGSYLWKNGSKYTGNFENDYRHGYGQMQWQDGRVYKGQWLNGIQKNTLITLDNPKAKLPAKNMNQKRTAFRSIQQDTSIRKKVPLDKLKSLYNPTYH